MINDQKSKAEQGMEKYFIGLRRRILRKSQDAQ